MGRPDAGSQSVTFAEDPRFGHEYFLRAESVTVRLRWQSLLRGHMELGTVSLTKPSLNLVRNSAGDWNLAEWLPRPSVAAFLLPASPNPNRPLVCRASVSLASKSIPAASISSAAMKKSHSPSSP